MTFAIAVLAAALAALPQEPPPAQDAVRQEAHPRQDARKRVLAAVRRRRPPKPRKDMTPVEAFHNFCRPGGEVKFQKDLRAKPFRKEAPDRRRKGPRK